MNVLKMQHSKIKKMGYMNYGAYEKELVRYQG